MAGVESADKRYDAIVMGTSAGGLQALTVLLEALPADFPLPIMLVQHRAKQSYHLLEEVLQRRCKIQVKQADEKEVIQKGIVYVAPPDYHLLVEADKRLSLSSDEPVCFSRPSIDVLFESAAMAYREYLVGIILTGSNADGASGIASIQRQGGLTIAQDPEEAAYAHMPQAAIDRGAATMVRTLSAIREFLLKIALHE